MNRKYMTVLQAVGEQRAVWLAWEKHRRTTEMAKALSLPLICYSDSLPRPLKYIVNGFRTTTFLLQAKPDVVVVQNPSLVLAWLTVLLKSLIKYRLVLDNHND